MRACELIKETFFRKSFIPILHIVWLLIYALLFLLPLRNDLLWGKVPFVLCGLILPLVLSHGIFGNDITSGRIHVLITKPMRISELYIWRFAGLAIQSAIHLCICAFVIFFLHIITTKGDMKNFIWWLFLSWVQFNIWSALSITLSVFTKRGYNFMVLTFGIVLVFALRFVLLMSPSRIAGVVLAIIKYAFPPVELLFKCGNEVWTLSQKINFFEYIIVLLTIYIGAGILILNYRDFKRQCD